MNHLANVLIAASSVALLAGCSFNPVGESNFDCNRKENPSEYCRSFKALEKSTNGPLPESRFDKEFKMSDYDRATGIAPDSQAHASDPRLGAGVLPHQQMNANTEPVAGMPLRRSPVVQRVFIKRFVDENDSLQDDVVVYREVKGAHWVGFHSAGQDAQMPGAYPHRARNSSAADLEGDESPPQQTNLAQPDSGIAGAAGSAMPPAGSQSGGLNAPKAER
ncbi:TraV family lipoprotein [Massilia sp.]|uniref:TraV family lipoprotein n=1 Tax=Massilia sp. TaxID=1882437 RepID=UPI00352D4076